MPRKLKVFRTAVGFRDAYVAAPSRAAALRAWGTDKDLFARGVAEEVTDAKLGEDALNSPGEVVYRTRGGLEEQVAALGMLPKARKRAASHASPEKRSKPKTRKPTPRPSRAALDAAEAEIVRHEAEQEKAEAAMQKRERALAAERQAMESRFARKRQALRDALEDARHAYRDALDRWEP